MQAYNTRLYIYIYMYPIVLIIIIIRQVQNPTIDKERHLPGFILPEIIHLGSYGALSGIKSMRRSTGSAEWRMGTGEPRVLGTKASQSRMAKIPSTSLATLIWVTPEGVCGGGL